MILVVDDEPKIVKQAREYLENSSFRVVAANEGIPPEGLPHIFDRFWRGDKSRSRGEGIGSGLGLAIAYQLVEAHGDRIAVESDLGEGTTFVIQLPQERES